MRRSYAFAIAASITAAVPAARADGAHPEASKLFAEGRALAERGAYAEACARFARSYELERAPGTALNLGDCAERAGQHARAWRLFDTAARDFEAARKAAGARFARGRADALAPRLATVTLHIAEPRVAGLVVRVGDREVAPAAEVVERLDPGAIAIAVTAPGREPFARSAEIAAGREEVIAVPAMRIVERIGAGEPARDEPRAGRRTSRVVLAAATAGAGALALGAAGVLGLGADRAYEEPFERGDCARDAAGRPRCNPEGYADVQDALRRADVATWLGVGGAALVAAGAAIYLTAPRDELRVAPVASPGAVGVALGGRF